MSNSEYQSLEEVKKRVLGLNLSAERGTTQTIVKVPKCQLSIKGQRVSITRDSEEVGSEAAIL